MLRKSEDCLQGQGHPETASSRGACKVENLPDKIGSQVCILNPYAVHCGGPCDMGKTFQ